MAVTGLPSDHFAPGCRCTVSDSPLGESVQDLARPGSSWSGFAELPAFHPRVIESNEGNTLLVALKGFIGAPGVITVFGLMVVKVTLLSALPLDSGR